MVVDGPGGLVESVDGFSARVVGVDGGGGVVGVGVEDGKSLAIYLSKSFDMLKKLS